MQYVTFKYRNHRGEVSDRRVVPQTLEYRTTAIQANDTYHNPGWYLDALDYTGDRNGLFRSFALNDILLPPSAFRAPMWAGGKAISIPFGDFSDKKVEAPPKPSLGQRFKKFLDSGRMMHWALFWPSDEAIRSELERDAPDHFTTGQLKIRCSLENVRKIHFRRDGLPPNPADYVLMGTVRNHAEYARLNGVELRTGEIVAVYENAQYKDDKGHVYQVTSWA